MVDTKDLQSVECNNSILARQNPDVVDSLLKTEYVREPFSSPPFPTYRVSPLGIATHKYSGGKNV
jgi:hypothetical protein